MLGIKFHTHRDRQQLVGKIVTLVQGRFGDNLIALAADGSFARGEDQGYSDLEVVVFVHSLPQEQWEIRQIVDGILVVVIVETKETYIRKYLDVTSVWYASGAGKLLPIINAAFITEVNAFIPKDSNKKIVKQLEQKWIDYQEITAKVLNISAKNNREGLPLMFVDMVKEVCILLSYLNHQPYMTFSEYITKAKSFSIQPEGLSELLLMTENGEYTDFKRVVSVTQAVFSSLEDILLSRKIIRYQEYF